MKNVPQLWIIVIPWHLKMKKWSTSVDNWYTVTLESGSACWLIAYCSKIRTKWAQPHTVYIIIWLAHRPADRVIEKRKPGKRVSIWRLWKFRPKTAITWARSLRSFSRFPCQFWVVRPGRLRYPVGFWSAFCGLRLTPNADQLFEQRNLSTCVDNWYTVKLENEN